VGVLAGVFAGGPAPPVGWAVVVTVLGLPPGLGAWVGGVLPGVPGGAVVVGSVPDGWDVSGVPDGPLGTTGCSAEHSGSNSLLSSFCSCFSASSLEPPGYPLCTCARPDCVR
jgi:hypothetical protein